MKELLHHSLIGARWVLAESAQQRASDNNAAPSSQDELVIELASTLRINRLLASVLVGRGLDQVQTAKDFLDSSPEALHDPMLMPDMREAVDMVASAIDNGVRIRLHGDYDVDGVASCALLERALSALGAKVDSFVPHRIDDGYGVGKKAIEQAAADGVKLLLTCDCGSGSPKEVTYATSLGMNVVVTDHHLPGRTERLSQPSGEYIPEVNPRRHDSEYPFPDLSGVGVAFKFVEALALQRGVREQAHWRFLDLVALGTVADVSSLLGENRFLVKRGLQLIGQSKKLGITSLLRSARVLPPISSRHVAFILAPRINAAGRLAHAREAFQLLMTMDPDEAQQLAEALCVHNKARQGEEARVLREALELIEERDLAAEKVLVVAGAGWHPGVIGIVASRLVETYHRPVFLAALPTEGDARQHAVGSARSIAGFPIWDAMHASRHVLVRYGGHAQAGGFSVMPENVDALREQLCLYANEFLQAELLQTSLYIDAEAMLCDLTLSAVEELEKMEPFGADNDPPTVMIRDVKVLESTQVGEGGVHLRTTIQDATGRTMRTIWFRSGDVAGKIPLQKEVDVCLTPGVSVWNGTKAVELRLKDIAIPHHAR